jgi:hypothetical protein
LRLNSTQSRASDPTKTKIFPRNLTARAEFQVVGNPVITRPEDAVANCFPGLELDVRNLDRRFFPGLVFNFVEPGGKSKAGITFGAKLAYVDVREDPDLQSGSSLFPQLKSSLYAQLTGQVGNSLADGNWYLEWIKQDEKEISTRGLTGLAVWRLIRGLEPKPVSVRLRRRDKRDATVELHGWRRSYTDPDTGVISGAYQSGEMTQGLCSPWQHDFRDCYCHYWASNHPDLVFGEIYPGEAVLPGGDAEATSRNLRLDWLRADRSRALAVGAFGVIEKNRLYQFDHYQINHEWQNLNVVLEGREIDSLHLADPADAASPYNQQELVRRLREFLAPLELTLAFEYLYARFSLRDRDDLRQDALRGPLAMSREYLLLIAISEMQHLRWDNEILYELYKARKIDSYDPIIRSAELVPEGTGGWLRTNREVHDGADGRLRRHKNTEPELVAHIKRRADVRLEAKFSHPSDLDTPTEGAFRDYVKKSVKKLAAQEFDERAREIDQNDLHAAADKACAQLEERGNCWGWRKRALRLMDRDVQDDLIRIEHPNAFIDHHYARVLATLEQPGEYPPHLAGLVRRILSDGIQHESRLNAIKAALEPFELNEYLRMGMQAKKEGTKEALVLRDNIIESLKRAYTAAARENIRDSSAQIAKARSAMNRLLELGEDLAKRDIGIPFFDGL